jgi:NAD(P)-dependent dehydrogenase (short-subunit alcohol dehydrogenase family)
MGNYVITGANSEIGEALSAHLSRNGHKLLLVSRSPKRYFFPDAHQWIERVDLLSEPDILNFRESICRQFNKPFNLIHSVGDFWRHKSIENTPFEEAVSMINSHYITLFNVIKAIIPVMKEVGGGRIIAFSCNSVKYNYPDMAVFTAAKAAVECLIKCVANELSQYNITANAFALPSIKTNSVKATKAEEYHKDYTALDELACCIEQIVESLTNLTNGNIVGLFKYSNSFYHKGYYERNIIWEGNSNEKADGLL